MMYTLAAAINDLDFDIDAHAHGWGIAGLAAFFVAVVVLFALSFW